jgi:hypothetical protein
MLGSCLPGSDSAFEPDILQKAREVGPGAGQVGVEIQVHRDQESFVAEGNISAKDKRGVEWP